MNKGDFDFLLNVLKENAGWRFSEEDYFVLDKKISNFIREKGYASVEELIDELRLGQKAFVQQLIESMALLGTSFFRDYHVFKQFGDVILPYLREYNRGLKKLKVWSAGCSTGQETYSIAMEIKDKLLNVSDWQIQIIGTDISEDAIVKAQSGIYNQFEIQMGMNARKIIKYFHQDRDLWIANDDLLSMVEFKKLNLLEDFSHSQKFDVVFCRNVLKLFTPENQKDIISKIYLIQTPGGLLYLGKDEKIEGIEELYTKVPGFDCLYQANAPEQKNITTPSLKVEQEGKKGMPSFGHPDVMIKRPPLSSLLKK